jgi:hypothetical protein
VINSNLVQLLFQSAHYVYSDLFRHGCGKKRNVYRDLEGKPKRKRPLGRLDVDGKKM